jgi:Na+-driven multidrug efflux pump
MIAFGAEGAHIEAANNLLTKIESVILFPLMTLMMAVAFLVFLYGGYELVLGAGDESARSKGKTHMLWGIIGMLVMLSAFAILQIATNTVGCDINTPGGCGEISVGL